MRRVSRRTLAVALVALGCDGTRVTGFVALPDVELAALPAARGSVVEVRVRNTTAADVTLIEPGCTAHLIELVGDSWRRVEDPPPCSGVDVALPPGAAHPFALTTPPGHGGRYRVVIHGRSADGAFLARSDPFNVE